MIMSKIINYNRSDGKLIKEFLTYFHSIFTQTLLNDEHRTTHPRAHNFFFIYFLYARYSLFVFRCEFQFYIQQKKKHIIIILQKNKEMCEFSTCVTIKK